MEGLFACLPVPGKLAWRRRCSQASDFRRHLGPGSSLPGGQHAWEAVKQTPPGKSVGDEGVGHGGAEGDDGSPPPIGTPTTLSSVTDDCCDMGPGQKQIPPKAPMPPPSMEVALAGQEPLLLPSDGAPPGSHQVPVAAALEGLHKKEKSFTYLRHVSCSTTKQDIEEPEVSLLKFKGIPVTDSLILEESRINLTNTTATFPFEKDTGENRGALLLNVKGISSPDPLCDCVASTKTYGNAYANKDEQPVRSINVAKSLTQLFVKVCQKEVSLQEDCNTTTIKELIDSACRKAGIKACDFYAVYGGKRLKADKPIAYYPIFKDSTVHLRSRLRAGREYESVTFEAWMSENMDKRFRQVTLSALSINRKKNQISSVTFLSKLSAYYIHKIMVYICGKHRKGLSFDGKFTASDILIINKTMVDFDTSNLRTYDFSEHTCSNDYAKLYEIFSTYFTEGGMTTAMYFENFLIYLFHCPAKEKSNSEPVIHYITNHPALTSYMDRIKQCLLLDSMARRLDINDKAALDTACIPFPSWLSVVQDVPALNTVYLYNSKTDPIKNKTIVNPEYNAHILGCLHFARNYFSHADYQMKLLEVEAAFAATLQDFLPTILLNVAMDFNAPADFDILTLLGNPLADSIE